MRFAAVFRAFAVFRCLNALCVATFHSPDEYFQAPEVAHRLVFGVGAVPWEWLPEVALRSHVHVAVYVPALAALRATGLDVWWAVAAAPKLTAAVVTAAGDAAVVTLAASMWGRHAARWTAWALLVSWYSLYMVRPYSGCIAAAATAVALRVLWGRRSRAAGFQARPAAAAWAGAAAACVVRPPVAVLWAVVGVCWLLDAPPPRRPAMVAVAMGAGGAVFGVVVAIDSALYGRLTVPMWNFLAFNVGATDGAAVYGTHPPWWYIGAGVPAVCGTLCFPIAVAAARRWSRVRRVLLPAVVFVAALSVASSHKEERFLTPAMPLATLAAGLGLAHIHHTWLNTTRGRRWRRCFMAAVAVPNVVAALYLCQVHQRGPITVAHRLAAVAAAAPYPVSVHYLMPCHAVPAYSVLHAPVRMWSPDCSAPVRLTGAETESGALMRDPAAFVDAQLGRVAQHRRPTHVVMFSTNAAALGPLLSSWGYVQDADVFHTLVHGDSDAVGPVPSVLILRRHDVPSGIDSSSSGQVPSVLGAAACGVCMVAAAAWVLRVVNAVKVEAPRGGKHTRKCD